MNDRKEYIDIAKGIVILWVVWMHIGIHSLLYASVQMPFFFLYPVHYGNIRMRNLEDL